MLNNEKILKNYNTNHEDTLFKTTFKTSKKSIGKNTSAIIHELFQSDSEQDISLHSARTPITAFYNRNSCSKNNEDNGDADDEHETNTQNYQTNAEPGYVF